jgi:dUTP pyrophosphatase
MNLIIEKMFDDAVTPSKEHSRSSGFDLYAHRFIKIYVNRFMTDAMVSRRYGESTNYPCDSNFCVTFDDGLRSNIIVGPHERVMIGTGIKARVDYRNSDMANFSSTHSVTWELQVRPRSGTALKRGLTVLNTPGTVDDGYTGEICIIMANVSHCDQIIEIGERVAQIVPCMVGLPTIINGTVKSTDSRGEGGFNSTGRY